MFEDSDYMNRINNNGFTLVELIVTIALLAVISIISFVAINGVIEKNKVSNCETLVDNIKMATKEYISDHRYDDDFNKKVEEKLDEDGKKIYVLKDGLKVIDLISNNYLTGSIYDPFNSKNDEDIANRINVDVTLNNKYLVTGLVVKTIDEELDEHVVNCNNGKW